MVVKKPQNDIPCLEEALDGHTVVRIFSKDVLSDELVWHRDRERRIVEVLEGSGWEIQVENRLPEPLVSGRLYDIPAYKYHRIRRGTEDLKVRIRKIAEIQEKRSRT